MTRHQTEFQAVGWHHFREDTVATDVIKRCANKKSRWLDTVFNEVGDAFGKDLSNYTDEFLVECNIAKSIIRALFRVDPDAREMARIITAEVKSKYGTEGETFYSAPPYTYVHILEDASEQNAMHMDVYGDFDTEHYTIWVPLNPCTHKPLTVAPRTHKERSLVKTLSILERRTGFEFPLYQPRTHSPDTELGDYLIWDARLHHAGNLNTSSQPHVAVNFKLRSLPIPMEPSSTHDEVLGDGTEDEVDASRFTQLYLKIFKDIENSDFITDGEITAYSSIYDADRLIDSWNLETDEKRRVSFALTLGAMRRDKLLSEVVRINLVAILLAPEFLWSLNNVADYFFERADESELSKLCSAYFERYHYYQIADVLRNISDRLAIDVLPGVKPALEYPVYGWAK